jgi:VIT1/CCC1 family predicted Fe2+/Mn2+ transporter
MALTFTGTLSAATAGQEEIRTMLLGAIGCNIAWGLVDAVMYLVARLTEQGRGLLALRGVREAAAPADAYPIIADALPPIVVKVLRDEDLENIRTRLGDLPPQPPRPGLGRDDWLGALGVFLLVCLSTFPVVIPFIFMSDATVALRVSNGIAVGMMFLCGYRLGHYSANRPWLMGAGMAVLGTVLVVITIALGG